MLKIILALISALGAVVVLQILITAASIEYLDRGENHYPGIDDD